MTLPIAMPDAACAIGIGSTNYQYEYNILRIIIMKKSLLNKLKFKLRFTLRRTLT